MASGALLAAAAVTQVAGSLYQGFETDHVERFNAKMFEKEAAYQKVRSTLDVKRHERAIKRLIGEQRVQAAASGIEFAGTPLEAMTDTEQEAALDAWIIRFGGEARAAQARAQASEARRRGSTAITGSLLKSGGTILTYFGEK